MTYLFECEECDEKKEVDIPMSEYDNQKNNQICDCGGKLHRVIQFDGAVGLCSGMYGTNSNGSWNN